MRVSCKSCINSMTHKYSPHGYICNCGDADYAAELEIEGVECANTCSRYSRVSDEPVGLIDNDKALRYILAGRCEFIAVSGKTGAKLEFTLKRKESTRESGSEFVYFVGTKINNIKVYGGIVVYDYNKSMFIFHRGAKGKLNYDNINIKSLMFILNNLHHGNKELNAKIYHTGKCGRCGRKLTTEESILTGLGPTCSKLSNVPRVKR